MFPAKILEGNQVQLILKCTEWIVTVSILV